MPGCMGTAVYQSNDFSHCTCPRKPDRNDLEQRVLQLEKKMATVLKMEDHRK